MGMHRCAGVGLNPKLDLLAAKVEPIGAPFSSFSPVEFLPKDRKAGSQKAESYSPQPSGQAPDPSTRANLCVPEISSFSVASPACVFPIGLKPRATELSARVAPFRMVVLS